MKILLTGKNGQLGQALQTRLHELVGLGDTLVEVLAVDRTQLDLSNPESCRALMQSFQPDLVINAAAYTAVDKAEQEEAGICSQCRSTKSFSGRSHKTECSPHTLFNGLCI